MRHARCWRTLARRSRNATAHGRLYWKHERGDEDQCSRRSFGPTMGRSLPRRRSGFAGGVGDGGRSDGSRTCTSSSSARGDRRGWDPTSGRRARGPGPTPETGCRAHRGGHQRMLEISGGRGDPPAYAVVEVARSQRRRPDRRWNSRSHRDRRTSSSGGDKPPSSYRTVSSPRRCPRQWPRRRSSEIPPATVGQAGEPRVRKCPAHRANPRRSG